jgi:hypothetical protein
MLPNGQYRLSRPRRRTKSDLPVNFSLRLFDQPLAQIFINTRLCMGFFHGKLYSTSRWIRTLCFHCIFRTTRFLNCLCGAFQAAEIPRQSSKRGTSITILLLVGKEAHQPGITTR